MNEYQILKEHQISKHTKIMNEHQTLKDDKFPMKPKLQTKPKF